MIQKTRKELGDEIMNDKITLTKSSRGIDKHLERYEQSSMDRAKVLMRKYGIPSQERIANLDVLHIRDSEVKECLADQKQKIREWLHNWLDNKYKDNDLWRLSETELYELLLKEFEEV